MKKLTLALLLASSVLFLFTGLNAVARVDSVGISAVEYNLEALFNQSGEFRGCPYSGSDCRRIIIAEV